MEVKSIYNLPITPLVTAMFSVKWSEDNQISIATEKGIYILELKPTPLSTQQAFIFSRSFIYPSEWSPMKEFSSCISSTVWTLDREELYLLLMEEFITPRLPDANEAVPRIIDLAWSPQRLASPLNCLLAIITSIGAVNLCYKPSRFFKKWPSICNLSENWLNAIQEELEINNIPSMDKSYRYSALITNARRLQATALTWSNLYEHQTCFAYLTIAYRSTDIAIWKIPKIQEFSESISPIIVFKTRMKHDDNIKINVIRWIDLLCNRCLIILAYFNGLIEGLCIDRNKDDFQLESLEKYCSYADHIPVSFMEILSHNENGAKVLVCKNWFLMLLDIDNKGVLLDLQYLQLEGYCISGLTLISEDKVLATTQDGKLFYIRLKEGRLISRMAKHNFPKDRMQYLGLAASPNRCIVVNVSSPHCMYDHLVVREPTKLRFCTLEGTLWDPLEIISRSKITSISNKWDCLELLRLKVIKSGDLDSVIPNRCQDSETLSIYKLRVLMWTSIITEAVKMKRSQRSLETITDDIVEVQPLVTVFAISDHVQRLAKSSALTENDLLCIMLVRMYLDVYLAGEDNESNPVADCARKTLEVTSHIRTPEVELCEICGDVITELHWYLVTCSSGHRFPRCALTFLHVSSLRYRSCPICLRVLHPCLDRWYECPRCPFCEVPALYDDRIVCDNDLVHQEPSMQQGCR
ncbi:uncharacterized protein LOC105701502 isoform X2 [Orussus abietinus]|nr:uncharacterized protein LOC105701502 isoform X2 [Orussus abietinus]XP_012283723.1 uncharacterized protein LOC105701502 isoform X2 [Orussus abietinus]XP_012283724.1 uncharacterized protein LOC105701502 isoform X2 [Orussus abietinus]